MYCVLAMAESAQDNSQVHVSAQPGAVGCHPINVPVHVLPLHCQVSFRNRVLILFDWLKAQVFGRDLSQF